MKSSVCGKERSLCQKERKKVEAESLLKVKYLFFFVSESKESKEQIAASKQQ